MKNKSLDPRFWYFLRGMIRGWLLFGCFNALTCLLILYLVAMKRLDLIVSLIPTAGGFAVWEVIILATNIIWLALYVPYKAKRFLLSKYEPKWFISRWNGLPFWLPGLIAGAAVYSVGAYVVAGALGLFMSTIN